MIVGLQYNAAVGGSVVKDVECESCRTEYVYLMERVGKGVGNSLYLLDNEGAERRAESAAHSALERKLQRECDVVPCPSCGHVQQQMVRRAKRNLHRWVVPVGIACLAIGLILVMLEAYWISMRTVSKEPILLGLDVAWGLVVAGIGLVILRRILAALHDPNSPERRGERMAEAATRTMSKQE